MEEFWEKQEDETNRSYAAFVVYRDLGPRRSLRRAAAEFYDSGTAAKPHQERQFFEWSRTNLWVARAEAWDAEQRRQSDLKRQEAAEDARDRALRAAQLTQRIGLSGMMQLANRMEPEEKPAINLLRYVREGIEMEFLALGLPISVVRQVEEPDPNEAADRRWEETYRRASKAFE